MYNPSIKWLVDNDQWGDPLANRANLVPYPWGADSPINQALYGINMSGELIGIQGPNKNRKTTFLMNIVYFIMAQEKPKDKPNITLLTLESGSRPRKLKDILICMQATDLLLKQGKPELCVITPKFLRYNRRTPEQQKAIDDAVSIVREWPIYLYGPGKEEGDVRNPDQIKKVITQAEGGIVALDHAQQIQFDCAAWEKLGRAVDLFAYLINYMGIVGILLSQVSLTSVRAYQKGEGELTASGGMKLEEEANVLFNTLLVEENLMEIAIHRARDAEGITVLQPLEPHSGLFWKPPRLKYAPKPRVNGKVSGTQNVQSS